MVSMGHCLMSTAWTMDMVCIVSRAYMVRCAGIWILCRHLQPVLVHMVAMNMMEVSIVEIVHMIAMLNGRMATIRSMYMRVICMDLT